MNSTDNPKWVQADSVERATPDGNYVNVTAYGETFTMCRREWSSRFADRAKSDVLVQMQSGKWLRVWFFDSEIA